MKALTSLTFSLFLFLFSFSFNVVNAQQTEVMIRVKSKDAKFIGTSIGGARIIVREEVTGKILAEGITQGSTGNTDLIIKEPQERGKEITDASTAGFKAVLDISQPTFITIEAYAPVNKKQATVKSSTQMWVIPGRNITGDGIILEVPGFVVDILSPQTHERISAERQITLTANVVMMCGCPVTEGGIWDARNYEVKAVISREGEVVTEQDMQVQEKESTFSATTSLSPGNYEILIYAFDPGTGNTGVDKVNVIIN